MPITFVSAQMLQDDAIDIYISKDGNIIKDPAKYTEILTELFINDEFKQS